MTCRCDHCLYHRGKLARVLAWAHAWELDMGPRISVIGPVKANIDAGSMALLQPAVEQWNDLQRRMQATFHALLMGA